METQEQTPLEKLESAAIVAAIPYLLQLGELGISAIIGLFTKHKDTVVSAKLVPQCPSDQHWNGSACVPNDPLPPDPTHPGN